MEHPHEGTDPVSGEPEPAYKRCIDVLHVRAVRRGGPCRDYKKQNEAPEMVVSHGRRGTEAKLKEVS